MCNQAGRCERTDALDRLPPELADGVSVVPAVGTVGTRFSVSFEVGEPLSRAPEVTLDLGTRRAVLEGGAVDGQLYEYTYEATGGEPEGAHALVVLLADAAGNEQREESESFVFDFTPPRVAGQPALSPALLAHGAAAQLDLAISEPLPEDRPPQVRFDSGRPWTLVGLREDGTYRYRYTAAREQDAEGASLIEVSLQDRAGNLAPWSGLGDLSVRFDFTAPEATACALTPVAASGRDTAVYRLSASEPLAEARLEVTGAVEALLQAEPRLAADGLEYLWEQPISGLLDQSYSVGARLVDLASNPSEGLVCVRQGLIDSTRPEVTGQRVWTEPELPDPDGETLLLAGDGQTIRAEFDVREAHGLPADAVTVVLDAPQPLPFSDGECLAPALGGEAWTCSFGLPLDSAAHGRAEGAWPVRVDVRDEACNDTPVVALADALVRVDFSAPAFETSVTPSLANARDVVLVTVAASEPLAPGSVALEHQPPGEADWVRFAAAVVEGQRATFRRDVADGLAHGHHPLRITLEDRVGNRRAGPLEQGIEVDSQPIELSDSSVVATFEDARAPQGWTDTGLLASPGSRVTIRFTLDEPPAPDTLEVRVGDDLAGAQEPEGLTWTFTHVVPEPVGQGLEQWPVTARLEDAAGNPTQVSLATLTIHHDPPAVSGTADFERCDDHPTASLARNELWVRRGYPDGCDFSFDPAACGAEGPLVSAPIEVRFSLTKAVRAATRRVHVAGHDLSIDPCRSTGSSLVALYRPAGDEPASHCGDGAECGDAGCGSPVVAEVEDLAGNPGSLRLGCLHFDFTPPALPDVAVSERIVYSRVPWGSEETEEHMRSFSVRGEPGAAPPGTRVFVYDREDVARAARVGVGAVDGQGAFGGPPGSEEELVLDPSDRPVVFLVAEDAAGNASDADGDPNNGIQAVPVRDVVWTATLGDKVPGSHFGNPHALWTRRWFTPRRVQGDEEEAPTPAAAVARDDGQVVATRGDGRWLSRMVGVETPPPRETFATAYDEARGRLVLFGGRETQGLLSGETWEWDGAAWLQRRPSDPQGDGEPPAREYHGMTYDSGRSVVVLFGGHTASGRQADAWEWDGDSWALREPSDPEGDGNPEPCGAPSPVSMAFDRARGRTVMVEECSWGERQLWEWDGASWLLHTDRDAEWPPPLASRLVFDPVGRRVLVWALDDRLWGWDGATWTPRRFEGLRPESRSTMAWDTARGRLVTYGSRSNWEWDGDHWYEIRPAGPLQDWPTPRSGTVSYDPRRQRVVLLGLVDQSGPPTMNVWEWDGASWARRQAGDPEGDGDPGSRSGHAMAYDARRGRIVLDGGLGGQDETWEWDGWSWAQALPGAPGPDGAPPGRREHVLVWDAERERVVLFGGDRVWEWDGVAWDARSEGGVGSSPAWGGAYAWDTARNELVIFVRTGRPGAYVGETWVWDGEVWAQRLPEDPGGDGDPVAAWDQAMVFDGVRRRTTLFRTGADDERLSEVWEWDGVGWTLRAPADPEADGHPPAVSGHALAWDDLRGRVLLFGGGGPAGRSDDTWMWDGVSWIRRAPADPEGDGNPLARSNHALAFDAARGRGVLHGGRTGAVFDSDETWEWDGGEGARPGQVLDVGLAAAAPGEHAGVWQVSADWSMGGIGYPDGQPSPGARLQVWDRGCWTDVGGTARGPLEPEPVRWQTSDPHRLVLDARGLFAGLASSLRLSAVPAAVNGLGYGSIETDYVEVTVRYHRGHLFGWGFDTPGSTEGWQIEGVGEPGLPVDGVWGPLPGGARLVSPWIGVATADHPFLQLRVRSERADTRLGVLWQRREGDEGDFDEARSVGHDLRPDGAWQVHRLALAEHAEWSGTLTRLGLDLPAAPEGQVLEIDWIRLTD